MLTKATQNLEQDQLLNPTGDAMIYALDKYIGINPQQQLLLQVSLVHQQVALVPNLIEYTSPTTSEVPGAEAAGAWSVSLMNIGNGRIYTNGIHGLAL